MLVYPYNGILFINKKVTTKIYLKTIIFNEKKTMKDCILCDFIYIKFLKQRSMER